ncbi:MAG: PSP1 domain-containing protein [Candidatus Zixiibacteriota bacterium]
MADLYLVEFKGSRKGYFYNTYYHTLKVQEYVIVQADQGEDMGLLTLKINTEIDFSDSTKPRSILRRAGEDDLTHFRKLKENEIHYKKEIIELIKKHQLVMKVVDVEIQYDGNKITFYFTADHRVDFRALVRDLAARYRTRIELRQIGVRDEARRIGGFGICGRLQCCNSHIKEFAPISTQHAREQDLSLNPSKISGNCGRLLCCLKYENDFYVSSKRKFPETGSYVFTKKGDGTIERIDVFTEEAVIVNDDGIPFRAGIEEIMEVKKGKAVRPEPYRSREEEAELDEMALKKLDEPDDVS